MKSSILVPLTDSDTSRDIIEYMSNLPLRPNDVKMTLLHVFRKSEASEDLMGKKFVSDLPVKWEGVLSDARDKLVEKGYIKENIHLELVLEPYPTVADAIIDIFQKGGFQMVVIGRKKMSKAEEFVLGDISVKLVRVLESSAVLVVKCV